MVQLIIINNQLKVLDKQFKVMDKWLEYANASLVSYNFREYRQLKVKKLLKQLLKSSEFSVQIANTNKQLK